MKIFRIQTRPIVYSKVVIGVCFLFFLGILFLAGKFIPHKKSTIAIKTPEPTSSQTASQKNVLGSYTRNPQIYLSSGNDSFHYGGVIELASTDEPSVLIDAYSTKGTAEISMYTASEDALFDYITHDDKGMQTQKTPDSGKIHFVATVKKDVNTNGNNSTQKISLPLGDTGIWYIKVKLGSSHSEAFIIRSNIGAIAKEGDDKFIFWVQNFKTKKSVSEGVVIPYNLTNGRKELERASVNSEGIAQAKLTKDADIALVAVGNERALIPLNLKYLNSSPYATFSEKLKKSRYFIFTDRPLYKPGDTVYYKAILRDDDDARYSIPQGNATVKVYNGYYYEYSTTPNTPIYENTSSFSEEGTINGQFQIPADEKVGYHSLVVNVPNQSTPNNYYDGEYSSNSISFDVEYFKKPEFSIDVTVPKTEIIAGDTSSFTVKGSYFSGQPLAGQSIKYTVYASDFYEYEYLADQTSLSQSLDDKYRYGYWYGSNKVLDGKTTLNEKGEAEIDVNTKLPFAKGKSQVFSIEATIDDSSQTPSFSRKNLLVHAGEYGIYRKDYSYSSKINAPLSLPVSLRKYQSRGDVNGVNLTAKVHRENWIEYKADNQKYPSYKKEEEDLSSLSAKTDTQGNATFSFTPTKKGSYTISVQGKDTAGNLISKDFYYYVSSEDYGYYTQEQNNYLTLITDKKKYSPSDTVKVNISSYVPDRDVFLALERGRVDRFQIVHLKGKSGSVNIPLINTDIPNMYIKVSSFDDNSLNDGSLNVSVSSESKKLNVTVTPNTKTYGPGETATVNILTTDVAGNPVSADLAFWAVDKAIFELSDIRLGDIFDTFWKERYDNTREAHSLEGILAFQGGGGGCFAKGTKVLMADNKLKNIEDVKEGDYVLTRENEKSSKLVKAKVLQTHKVDENGYITVNGNLKVTANHFIYVNNSWKEAGSIQTGDTLTKADGKKVLVSSVEWQAIKAPVYNLTVENYHTYFADNMYVHNDKGIERNAFKDTAYWNPSVHTDQNGRALVSFKLPDNLTTWTLAAVASTIDTRVGQTTNEITVTKDVIVRAITPNILRVGDGVVLSALVQNFTNQDLSFNTELKFDSGTVEKASQSNVKIKSNETKQLYWTVKPTKENDKAKLTFSAVSTADSSAADILTQEIPVKLFGFEEKRAETGENNKSYAVKLSPDTNKDKSAAILSLSPTIIGTLPSAMNYLVDYPYGCVEQTTSRFVPAVIAKANPQLFTSILADKNVDDIIKKGIARLATQQQSDGGWPWWFSGKSDPFITAHALEYLLQAKQLGLPVDTNMFDKAMYFLQENKYYDSKTQTNKYFTNEEMIPKIYGLALLGRKDTVKEITSFKYLTPDILSMAVIANYLNGYTNPKTNGLSELVGMAQVQGDSVFWKAGNKTNFGSQEASTAWAIRAILTAGGDRTLAAKAVKYLSRTRKYDYWANTYATSQIVRALTDFSKTGNESSPNYTYTVFMDGNQITQGNVISSQQQIKDIFIPVDTIKSTGSKISVQLSGSGQLYSTLTVKEFHTDKNSKEVNHGLYVKREYINEKAYNQSLAVGDTALVKITVGGLKSTEYYGVINDELPAGLVPINESFKNEQYGQDPYQFYYYSYDITDREITENGEVLSLYQIPSGEKTYTYRARVVSEGTFSVPPATASLMYAPEIYGRSAPQSITITKESHILPGKTITYGKTPGSINPDVASLFIVLLVLISGFLIWRRRRSLKMDTKKAFISTRDKLIMKNPTSTTSVQEKPSKEEKK